MLDSDEEEIFGGKEASDDDEQSLDDDDLSEQEEEGEKEEVSGEEEEEEEVVGESQNKRRKITKNAFIDDEAELSGDDVASEDESDDSDQDEIDLDLVDKDAPELDSEEEEEIRGLYHKQLESEDKRAVLLMKEHLEDNEVVTGQRRRRKFRWQTKELMENSLKRHYDPDDDDSQEGDDDDDDDDYLDDGELRPRLSRLAVKPSSSLAKFGDVDDFSPLNTVDLSELPGTSGASIHVPVGSSRAAGFSDDSNSNTISKLVTKTSASTSSGINKFVFRDKELVEALSTKEVVSLSKEDKERVVQREVRRVLQSKSIFDQLYS